LSSSKIDDDQKEVIKEMYASILPPNYDKRATDTKITEDEALMQMVDFNLSSAEVALKKIANAKFLSDEQKIVYVNSIVNYLGRGGLIGEEVYEVLAENTVASGRQVSSDGTGVDYNVTTAGDGTLQLNWQQTQNTPQTKVTKIKQKKDTYKKVRKELKNTRQKLKKTKTLADVLEQNKRKAHEKKLATTTRVQQSQGKKVRGA